MLTRVKLFTAAAAIIILIAAPVTTMTAQPQDAAAQFATFSDEFMKASLVLSPSGASQAGYHSYVDPNTHKTVALDALLDDMSPEGIAKQRTFFAEWRERFRAETPLASLNPEDAADWKLIDDQIGLNLLEFDKIQSYKHNPTVAVELIGNAILDRKSVV